MNIIKRLERTINSEVIFCWNKKINLETAKKITKIQKKIKEILPEGWNYEYHTNKTNYTEHIIEKKDGSLIDILHNTEKT